MNYETPDGNLKRKDAPISKTIEMESKKKQSQKGQGMMEYIILSGLIGLFCIFAVEKYGKNLERKIEKATDRVNKTVKIR